MSNKDKIKAEVKKDYNLGQTHKQDPFQVFELLLGYKKNQVKVICHKIYSALSLVELKISQNQSRNKVVGS